MSESLDSSGFLPPPTLRRPHISNWAAAVEHSLRAMEGSGGGFASPPAQPLLRGMQSPGGSGRVDQTSEGPAGPELAELLEAVTRGGSVRQSPGVPPPNMPSYAGAGAEADVTMSGLQAMPVWTAPPAAGSPFPADTEELSINSQEGTPRRADTAVPGGCGMQPGVMQPQQHHFPPHPHQDFHKHSPQHAPQHSHLQHHHHHYSHITPPIAPAVPAPRTNDVRSAGLDGVQGRLLDLACDAEGSRVVQRLFDSRLAVAAGCEELLPHLGTLLCHPYGNYAVQRVLEHGDVPERMCVAEAMRGRSVELSLDVYGCRVLQRLIETSLPPMPPAPHSADATLVATVVELLHELDGQLDQIICDQNGNHVAQKILDCAPPHVYPTAFLIRAFCNNMPALGRHCYGCRVAQKVFEVCGDGTSMIIPESREAMDRLLQVVYDTLPILVADQYGNYVVQHMIANATPPNRSYVIRRLAPEIGALACDKFGSNVAERVLRCASETERDALVHILVTPAPVPVPHGHTSRLSPAASLAATTGRHVAPIALLMHDQFANYVVQRIIELASPLQQQRLVEAICAEIDLVRSTTFGQHLLLRLERLGWLPPGFSGLGPSPTNARGPPRNHQESDMRNGRDRYHQPREGGRGRYDGGRGGRGGEGTVDRHARGNRSTMNNPRETAGHHQSQQHHQSQLRPNPLHQNQHQHSYHHHHHSNTFSVGAPPTGQIRHHPVSSAPFGSRAGDADSGYYALPRPAGVYGAEAAARAQAAQLLQQHNPDVDVNSEAVTLVATALMMTQKPPGVSDVAAPPAMPMQRHHDPYTRARR